MTTLTVAQAATRPVTRIVTGIPWFDSITGGGLVRGSATLLYGAPGAGKSTMLAQVAGSVSGSLYVALEEDLAGVAARFLRLGLGGSTVLTDDVGELGMASSIAILDSLQLTPDAATTARDAVALARRLGIAVVLVCHATKGGDHAGPRKIEHLCDVTLCLMREPRAIVCAKNRYGPAGGIWLPLAMTERGLELEMKRYA